MNELSSAHTFSGGGGASRGAAKGRCQTGWAVDRFCGHSSYRLNAPDPVTNSVSALHLGPSPVSSVRADRAAGGFPPAVSRPSSSTRLAITGEVSSFPGARRPISSLRLAGHWALARLPRRFFKGLNMMRIFRYGSLERQVGQIVNPTLNRAQRLGRKQDAANL